MKLILEAIKSLLRKIEAQRTHYDTREFVDTQANIVEGTTVEWGYIKVADTLDFDFNKVSAISIKVTASFDEEEQTQEIADLPVSVVNNYGNALDLISYTDEFYDYSWAVYFPDQESADTWAGEEGHPFTPGLYICTGIEDKATVQTVTYSFTLAIGELKRLDEKYLPEGVSTERIEEVLNTARTAQTTADTANSTAEEALASAPDWEQNNESAHDYIRHRTHYTKVVKDGKNYGLVNSQYGNYTQAMARSIRHFTGEFTIVVGGWRYNFEKLDEFNYAANITRLGPAYSCTITLSHDFSDCTLSLTKYFDFSIEFPGTKIQAVPLADAFIPDTIARKTDIPDVPTIPDKLPNPNALTFTGAVEGTYDGSAPLTVEIPQGGAGGEKKLRLIVDMTIDTANPPEGGIFIDKDLDGNSFEVRRAFIQTDLVSNVSYLAIGINGLAWTYDLRFNHGVEPKYVEYNENWMVGLSSGRMWTNIAGAPLPSGGGVANAKFFGSAKSFNITATLSKGTYLKIWEVLD